MGEYISDLILGLPVWIILIGQISVAFIVVVCAWLNFRRIRFVTTTILQTLADNKIERAKEEKLVAQQLANNVAASTRMAAEKAEETANVVRDLLQAEVLNLRTRLHKVEGSVGLREDRIMTRLDEIEKAREEKSDELMIPIGQVKGIVKGKIE